MRVPVGALLASLAALAWLAMPGVALAHAGFVRSEPADVCGPLAQPRLRPDDPRCLTGLVLQQPPSTVRITFSEPVQLLGRGIRVLSPSGKPVQQGKPLVDGDQASVGVSAQDEGTYVVDWQVASEDTHPVVGRFMFSVGHPSPPAVLTGATVGQVAPVGLALQALSRWLHFAGYALAFGTLAVSLLLAGPPLTRAINTGIVLLVLAEPLALLGQTGSLGLDQMLDGDTMGDALASPFGRLLGFRLAAALLLWVVSGSLASSVPLPPRWERLGEGPPDAPEEGSLSIDRRVAVGAALFLGLALALIDGLGQHAASFRPEWVGLIVHALHLIGMAVWLGALVTLLRVWREGKPLAPLARIAAGGLGLIAVTGVAMAVVHLSGPADLLATTYGRVLDAKQLLLALAVALALTRRRAVELGAAGLLIGLAGLLVSLPPPR